MIVVLTELALAAGREKPVTLAPVGAMCVLLTLSRATDIKENPDRF